MGPPAQPTIDPLAQHQVTSVNANRPAAAADLRATPMAMAGLRRRPFPSPPRLPRHARTRGFLPRHLAVVLESSFSFHALKVPNPHQCRALFILISRTNRSPMKSSPTHIKIQTNWLYGSKTRKFFIHKTLGCKIFKSPVTPKNFTYRIVTCYKLNSPLNSFQEQST